VDGVLIIDKPAGLTSHDVVARVRRSLSERRVGHTGTLDPFATGVLVVLVGRATRLAQFLSGAEKEYEGTVRFGYATDTGDATGQPRQPAGAGAASKTLEALAYSARIEGALRSFCGEIDQVPPMYSAKKVKGRKLYEMARRGEEIERKPERVTIYDFEPIEAGGQLLHPNTDGTFDLSVRVVCSAGTYIRTLAESVGERLGVPAHLARLRRTRAGTFEIAHAITLEELNSSAETGDRSSHLLSPAAALSTMPSVHLTGEEARRARHGMALQMEAETASLWAADEQVRMHDGEGDLVAIGRYDHEARVLRPRIVMPAGK
jgi:tRNA pseudouridine55 synthase